VDSYPVLVEEVSFPGPTGAGAGSVRARLYHPVGVAHPSAMVVVHGVHRLGMDEPRLMRLAMALARHGYLVMTPQVEELADYNITKDSAAVIGASVQELARRSGAERVGLLGLSFAGGMALIAASDPAVGRELSVVAAIGAHNDLRRVLDFYETDEARAPDGTVLHLKAHEYGSLVVAYSHAAAFFAPEDVEAARLALRLLLREDLPGAETAAGKLSPAGRALMARLFAHDTKALTEQTRRGLDAAEPELEAASPHFYLARLHVPVMLLHGVGDSVVPPTETLWLEHDLRAEAPGMLRAALISGAIGHVELDRTGWRERWQLVEWVREMLRLVDQWSAERG
jgi:dienelactone hydrolase